MHRNYIDICSYLTRCLLHTIIQRCSPAYTPAHDAPRRAAAVEVRRSANKSNHTKKSGRFLAKDEGEMNKRADPRAFQSKLDAKTYLKRIPPTTFPNASNRPIETLSRTLNACLFERALFTRSLFTKLSA